MTEPQTEAGRALVQSITYGVKPRWMNERVAAIEQEARHAALAEVRRAMTSEDEIAHGEAYEPTRGGLGVCAYCDDGEWPCRTQRGIDRLRAILDAAETP